MIVLGFEELNDTVEKNWLLNKTLFIKDFYRYFIPCKFVSLVTNCFELGVFAHILNIYFYIFISCITVIFLLIQ